MMNILVVFYCILLMHVHASNVGVIMETVYPCSEYVVQDGEFPDRLRYSPPQQIGEVETPAQEEGVMKIGDVQDVNRKFSYFENGFEYFNLVDHQDSVVTLYEDLRVNGLTGAEVGLQTDILRYKGGNATEKVIDYQVVEKMQGFNKVKLDSAVFTYNIRCSGMQVRKAGPMNRKIEGRNDGSSTMAHIDQNPNADPLKSILESFGVPWLLKLPFMKLSNIWLPLSSVYVRPLIVGDTSRIKESEKVLVTFEPKFSNLEELGDPTQPKSQNFTANPMLIQSLPIDQITSSDFEPRFWYNSKMGVGDGVVFDTTETFHNAISVPGEKLASKIEQDIMQILQGQDGFKCIQENLSEFDIPKETSETMRAFLLDSLSVRQQLCNSLSKGSPISTVLRAKAEQVIADMVRESIDMRCMMVVVDTNIALAFVVALIVVFFTAKRIFFRQKKPQ